MTKDILLTVLSLAMALSSNAQVTDSVKTSFALPGERIQKVVKIAARDFGRRHARDYIAVAHYERTVRSGSYNEYCQLLVDDGLFGAFDFNQQDGRFPWDDPNAGCLIPLNSFMSLFRIPGGKRYCETYSSRDPGARGIKEFNSSYSQFPAMSPFTRLRAMELYGPININKVKCYTYSLEDYSPEKGLYTIRFKSKDRFFPKQTKLSGEGLLFISRFRGLVGFRLLDIEDRYSSFVRYTGQDRLTSVTSDDFEVYYKLHENVFVPESIHEEVRWREPADKRKKSYYFAENNPYRDPFVCGLVSTTKVKLSDHRLIDGDENKRYASVFTPSHVRWMPCLRDLSLEFPYTDLDKVKNAARIRTDLEAGGIGLEEQNQMQRAIFTDYLQRLNGGEYEKAKRALWTKAYAAKRIYNSFYR